MGLSIGGHPQEKREMVYYVGYQELKKVTDKDHFPLPFIDQVLDTSVGKQFSSFLDNFNGYN